MIPTPKKVISKLYQLMYDVDVIMYQSGIQYWIVAGTLLGAIRHGGIIPWDDDLDIGVLNTPRVLKILRSREFTDLLSKCGYAIKKMWFGYKIYYDSDDYDWIGLDIFTFEEKDSKYQFTSRRARKKWSKEYIKTNELYPLKRIKFGDFQVTCPQMTKTLLDRWFTSWSSVAYQDYNHQLDERIVPKLMVKLDKNTRQPAQPTSVKNRKCMNFNTFPDMYYINCSKHRERREKLQKQLQKHDLKVHRVPCVNGKGWSDAQICDMIKNKIIKKASNSKIEIGISSSHLKVLKQFVKTNNKYAIIIEDDAILKKSFQSNLKQILSNVPEFDVLYLYNGDIRETSHLLKNVMKISDKIKILQEPKPHNAGGVGYVVSRNYAKYLLKNAYPIKHAWDTFMGTFSFNKNMKYYTLNMDYNKGMGSALLKHPPYSFSQSTQGITDWEDDSNHIKYINC